MTAIPDALVLALQHHQAGRLQEAEVLYRQILQVEPDHPDALHLLGLIARQVGQHETAVELIARAIARKPAFAEAYYNLANVLNEQGKWEQAAAHYRHALAIKPSYAEAHSNLGIALSDACRFQESEASFRRALEIKPDSSETCNNLAGVLKDQGKIQEAMAYYRRALAIKPDNVTAHSNLLMIMSYDPDCDPKTIVAEHRKWNDRHARGLAPRPHRYENSPDERRRLRVGYVSGDFCSHPIGYWIEALLANRHSANFAAYGYYAGARVDQTTRRLQAVTDFWRSVAGMSDETAAELIRDDRIDILVDLSGHTGCNRLLVFARKPAPVQVTYLGSLATTGLTTMDYRLTDWFLSPSDTCEEGTEELIRLPGCFVCYAPTPDVPDVAPLPSGQKTGRVTFGSFNNPAKISPKIVALWADILRAVPESCLMVKYRTFVDSGVQDRYRAMFEAHGIDARRLELLPATPFPTHLTDYARVDIALDPFPYNGCYTSCEALWMGVPLITLAGSLTCGRYGVSVLSNLGLDDLIATTPEAYVGKAVSLANDRKRLTALRAELRPRMAASVLCDAKAFAQGVEQAYRSMWQRWCRR